MKIVCQKKFNGKGDYSAEDIQIFNESILEGIGELKGDWRKCEDNKGIYLTETEDTLTVDIKPEEVDFENIHYSLDQIKRDMLTVLENYAVPYQLV